MNIELVAIDVNEKEILRNLLEKYDYEFSQYDQRDVNDLGLYGYDYLDNYWTEEGIVSSIVRNFPSGSHRTKLHYAWLRYAEESLS